jgi:hypothetical protein
LHPRNVEISEQIRTVGLINIPKLPFTFDDADVLFSSSRTVRYPMSQELEKTEDCPMLRDVKRLA